jgi:hypothetical protein
MTITIGIPNIIALLLCPDRRQSKSDAAAARLKIKQRRPALEALGGVTNRKPPDGVLGLSIGED